jgi:Zn-dependent protease with chaperone function
VTPEPTNACLYDGRSGAGQAVAAILSGTTLQLRAADGMLVEAWPAETIIRTDPDAPTGATLCQRDRPARLVLDDTTLLAPLFAVGAPLHDPPSRWGSRRWLRITSGFVGLAAAIMLLVDQLPTIGAALLPRVVERHWSDLIEAGVIGRRRTCDAPAGTAAIARLMARLAAAAGLPAPRFTVVDTPRVNAFTLPDGRIIILRGLITDADDGDAFAGVIAHEMGHVLHQDPTREALRSIEVGLIASTLGWGGNVAGTMATLTYSRRAEAAADASAIETLQKAGLRADGLGRFFATLEAKGQSGGLPGFLSDHPSNADREHAVRVAPTGTSAFTAEEWSAVRAVCNGV